MSSNDDFPPHADGKYCRENRLLKRVPAIFLGRPSFELPDDHLHEPQCDHLSSASATQAMCRLGCESYEYLTSIRISGLPLQRYVSYGLNIIHLRHAMKFRGVSWLWFDALSSFQPSIEITVPPAILVRPALLASPDQLGTLALGLTNLTLIATSNSWDREATVAAMTTGTGRTVSLVSHLQKCLKQRST